MAAHSTTTAFTTARRSCCPSGAWWHGARTGTSTPGSFETILEIDPRDLTPRQGHALRRETAVSGEGTVQGVLSGKGTEPHLYARRDMHAKENR